MKNLRGKSELIIVQITNELIPLTGNPLVFIIHLQGLEGKKVHPGKTE